VARFASPGVQSAKAYIAGEWASGANQSFDVAQAGTYEIAYNPATGVYSSDRVDLDVDADGLSDAWERFHFYPATSAASGANPDGDTFDNLAEFQRGSDPTEFDYPSMGVAGDYNNWNWSARNMRYAGHGVWTLALPFLQPASGAHYKFGVGPTKDDDNWGQPTPGKPDGFKSEVNFVWSAELAGWHLITFNEKSFFASVVVPIAASADRDGDGMPDAWERAFALDPFANDGDLDADDDQVWNKFEYERGSSPRDASDSYSSLALVGSTLPYFGNSGWDRTDPRVHMRWVTAIGRWESLRFVPRERTLEVRANDLAATPGWITPGNQQLSFPGRGHYVVRFEEFSKAYTVLPLPTADEDIDGMADYWENYFGVASPGGDADGDGVNNVDEFTRGSDPNTRDRTTVMTVVGDVSGWNFTNSPMRWNSAKRLWERLGLHTDPGSYKIKFVAATNVLPDPLSLSNWSLNRNWGDDRSSNNLSRVDDAADIHYQITNDYRVTSARGYALFEFDEVWGYVARELSTNDTNSDGLPDEWAAFYGVSNAGGNPDGDSWLNISEYRRGSNPTNSDGAPKRMTVTGGTGAQGANPMPPLPHWQPTANNMTWSDQRLRWEWTGTFSAASTIQFKFSQATNNSNWTGGKSWGAGTTPGIAVDGGSNIFQNVVGSTKYLVHFDDVTGIYGVVPHPVWLDWLKSNNLDTNTPRNPWPLDSDNDGVANFQEYALGGNPNVRDRTAIPVSITTNVAGTNRLVLRWLERTNKDASLVFEPQRSTNLASTTWSSLVSSNSADTTAVPQGYRRKEVSEPLQGFDKFLRLKVNGP